LVRNKRLTTVIIREPEAWEHLTDFSFDVLLTNPPFDGEIRDQGILSHYELARKGRGMAARPEAKVERDVLFIERCLQLLKPGGRMAIVLPQGKFNNATLAYIREWVLRHARLLAVVGLHPNTFKPHTGTKTSILFLQKYTAEERMAISAAEANVRLQCPDYKRMLNKLVFMCPAGEDLVEEDLPGEVTELLHEWFDTTEGQVEENSGASETEAGSDSSGPDIEALEAERAEWEKAAANLQAAFEEAKKAKDKEKTENTQSSTA
jgi:type I restriction enzyme M protein